MTGQEIRYAIEDALRDAGLPPLQAFEDGPSRRRFEDALEYRFRDFISECDDDGEPLSCD